MMKKISRSTFYVKKFIPSLVFLFLGFAVIAPYLPSGNEPFSLYFLIPIGMGILAAFHFKENVWCLADIVYDNGNELIFCKGKKEQRVKLCDIIKVKFPVFASPRRIEIYISEEGKAGKKFAFRPLFYFNPFVTNPQVLELRKRVAHVKRIP